MTVDEFQQDKRRDAAWQLLRMIAAPFTPLLDRRQRVALTREVEHGWQDHAACASADPEAWFPEQGRQPSRQVTSVCLRCPVRRSCLASALLWNAQGVWAATDPADRAEAYRLLAAGVPGEAVLDLLLARPRKSNGNRRQIPLAPAVPPTDDDSGEWAA